MDEEVLGWLVAAVSVARNEQIKRLSVLKYRLRQMGIQEHLLDAVLEQWALYERSKVHNKEEQ